MTVQSPAPIPGSLCNSNGHKTARRRRPGRRAFGPGRYTKVSERVREFATFAPELSVFAWTSRSGHRLVGCARMWRVKVGGPPVTFLGPFAVEQGERSAGFGARMIKRACEAAAAAGETHVVLVGDEPYFSRVGFSPRRAARVVMPRPGRPATACWCGR